MKPTRYSHLLQRHILLPSLLVCAIGWSSPMALAQTNAKAAGYYEDALVRFEKSDMPGAIIQLKNALQIDNNMLPVHLLLGKALMRNGEVAAAEVAFTEALRLGVNRAEVAVQLGRALVAQGKHKTVLEKNTFASAGLPAGVQLQMLLLRASVHADMGDPGLALRAIDEARAIDKRNVEVWLSEVPVRIRARQFREAMIAAETALTLMPDSADASYQKGSVSHVQGDFRGALAGYDRALQTDQSHVEARVARVGIAMDQGRFEDARKDLSELQKAAPQEPRGAYLRALLAEKDGDANASRAALKEITEFLDPVPIEFIRFRPQLLMLNGLAHFGQNQGEKAKQYLEAFQRTQPYSPVAKLLARIYMNDGNTANAISVLEPYLRAQPGDGQALTLLAHAHMASGRNAKAAALMQDALKAHDSPAFRTALGLSLIGDGQTASGLAELESAYRKDPKQVQAAVALIKLYLRNNQATKAIPVAEQLVKLQGGNAQFFNFLGMAQGQSGNVVAARTSFERAIKLDPNLSIAKLHLAKLETATRAYDAATARLNDLLKASPNYSDAMYELAVVADRKGQPAEAQRWLEKARDSADSRDLRWDLELVEFHLRYGRPSDALDAAKLASGKAPEDLRALMAYSRAQLAIGDTISAKNTLTTATRYAEYNARMQVEIATLQLAANNPSGAAYSLEKALSSQPDFLPAQALMADVDLRLGDSVKAEKRAREVVAQNPKLAVGHSLLGDIAMARNQPSIAVDAYRRAHQAEPSTGSVLRLFGALLSQDGGRPALQLAEQWLKANPRDAPVHKAMADAHARAGNYQSSKRAYEAALRLLPGDAEALNNMANILIRLKDPASVKMAEAALANAPGNALVTDTLGWALFQNGQPERALQLLRDARLRQPGNPEIRYHLAVVLAQSGRKSEAREEVDASLKSGVSFEGFQDAKQLRLSLQ